MKSECGNGLAQLFGVAASHKRLQVTNSANLLTLMRLLTRTMKETDDDESDGYRSELATTMMTKKMRMMRMVRMMRMRMKGMMKDLDGDDEDDEDAEHENEDDDYDEQGCCRVAISIGSSKRKPPNAVIVSRQVL